MTPIPFPQQPGMANAPIIPGGQTMMQPELVTDALLRAAQEAARKALTASGQDCSSFGKAALDFAQAVVVLDPSRSQGGTPLDHDVALKTIEGQTQATVAEIQRQAAVDVEHVRGEHALRQARDTASAPTPTKQMDRGRPGTE